MFRTATIAAGLALVAGSLAQSPLTVTFVHTNDLHAHIEPTRIRDATYGGYARHATLFRELRAKEKNLILLNAGDTFQGTLYFNIYLGLADLSIMNILGYDAMTLGNHEFDRGPEPLSRFIAGARFPLLAANLDVSGEPLLKDKIRPSTVITVGGQRVGVVGLITSSTPGISSPGPTVKFLPELAAAQREVDALTAQGVNKIVLLTHIGYEEDKTLARQLRNVDLILGGHSHTPLGTPSLPGWRASGGPYPTELRDADGRPIYVAQAWEWGKVVGKIKINFDKDGFVRQVVEAKPIVVDDTIAEDPIVKSMVTALQQPLLGLQNQPIGEVTGPLERGDGNSPMGLLIADAMLEATDKMGVQVAFVNRGGVRSALEAGKITYGAAIAVQPFNNTLVKLTLTGEELRLSLEKGNLIPSRGTTFRYDPAKPEGQRVSEISVAGKAWSATESYVIAVPNFIANGGDNHEVIRDAKGERIDTGLLDIDALVDYIKRKSPITPMPEVRILPPAGSR